MMALVLVSALAFAGCGSNSSDAPAAAPIKPTFVVKDSGNGCGRATVYAIPAADVTEISAVPLVVERNLQHRRSRQMGLSN
jgi:hypothetical protein